MNYPEVLIRPELEKKAYRLRCRFVTPAYPDIDRVHKLKYKIAEDFVRDMELQGWKYTPERLPENVRGFKLTGPYPVTPVTGLPTHAEMIRFNAKNGPQSYMAVPPGYAQELLDLDESENWEFEISAVFIREQLMAEVPDSLKEENEVMRHV